MQARGPEPAHTRTARVSALTRGRTARMRAHYTQRCRNGARGTVDPGRAGGSKDQQVKLEPNGNGVPFGMVSAAAGFKRPNK